MGWARANILYDKGPLPEPGSLQEALHILVFRSREEFDALAVKGLLTPEGSKAREEIFMDYLDSRFPYLVKLQKKGQRNVKDILEQAFAQGPIPLETEQPTLRENVVARKGVKRYGKR